MAMAAMQPMTIPAMAPPASPLLEFELELEVPVVICGIEEVVVVAGLSALTC